MIFYVTFLEILIPPVKLVPDLPSLEFYVIELDTLALR